MPPSAESNDAPEAKGTRAPMAVDFWGGVTAPEELVHFPGPTAQPGPGASGADSRPENLDSARPRASATTLRSLARMRGRAAVLGLGILFVGLVAIRAFSPPAGHAGHAARSDKVAQLGAPGRVTDFRDEPRAVGVRRLARTHRAGADARGRHPAAHRPAAHATSGGSAASTGQPISYSPPVTTQRSPVSSRAIVTSSDSGSSGPETSVSGSSRSGSGGSSRSGHRSPKPGPIGPGSPFGPGTLGK